MAGVTYVFSANTKIKSSEVNQNFLDIYPAVPQAFTPAWTSSGAQPSIGNGTLTGWYVQMGKLIKQVISLTWGSTTSSGTGIWFFGLALNAKSAQDLAGNTTAYGNDAGVNTYTAIGTMQDSARIVIVNSGGGNQWNPTVPFTWGTGDFLRLDTLFFTD